MSIPVRNVIGYINDLNSNPIVGAVIRASVYNQPLLDTANGIGIVTDYIETVTTSTGFFSITLPQSYTVLLSIPSIGYYNDILIPNDASTPINFTSITPS